MTRNELDVLLPEESLKAGLKPIYSFFSREKWNEIKIVWSSEEGWKPNKWQSHSEEIQKLKKPFLVLPKYVFSIRWKKTCHPLILKQMPR